MDHKNNISYLSLLPGLRRSCTYEKYVEPSEANKRYETVTSNTSFTVDDIEPLIHLLLQCPAGPLKHRIFQQHESQGTCWHDTLFMLLFNCDVLKPIIENYSRKFLEISLELGYSDLKYIVNYSFNKGSPEIAKRFQIEGNNPELKLFFWEFLVHAIKRNLLLNYLFLKHSEIIMNTEKQNLTEFRKRRKSINAWAFNERHCSLKRALSTINRGMHCENFQLLKEQVAIFLRHISRDTISLQPFFSSWLPSMIEAYYFGLDTRHINGSFKCSDNWYHYDNELGLFDFTPEDSKKISEFGVKGFQQISDPPAGIVKIVLILRNDEGVETSMPINFERKNSPPFTVYEELSPDFSFVILNNRSSKEGGKRNKQLGKRLRTRHHKKLMGSFSTSHRTFKSRT